MTFAAITGWGKCAPPSILSNQDLSTIIDTTDEWIHSRTGMRERRISHVPVSDLAHIACQHALACAGKQAADVDMIIFGSCSFDTQVPNAASRVQQLLDAKNAACMDLNTACTSGMYALSVANAMIKTGAIKSALVIGAEVISPLMDWTDRNVAILFGDGAAAFYLEQSEEDQSNSESFAPVSGLLAESLGCFGEARHILAVQGMGTEYANKGWPLGTTTWDFEGKEIFKRAVGGMLSGCEKVMKKQGVSPQDINVIVPHQANLRIIESLAQRLNLPDAKLFINIERYGNMSAATAPMALVEAVEESFVNPNDLILLPAFGAGLSWSAQLIRWGERTHNIERSEACLPDPELTGLEMVQGYLKNQKEHPIAI